MLKLKPFLKTCLRATGDIIIDIGATNSVTAFKKWLHTYVKLAAYTIGFDGATVGYLGYGYLIIDFYSYKVKTKVFHFPSAQSTIVM